MNVKTKVDKSKLDLSTFVLTFVFMIKFIHVQHFAPITDHFNRHKLVRHMKLQALESEKAETLSTEYCIA